MYSVFEKLLEEKGVTAYRVSMETGVGRSTFTDWKTGRSNPKGDKLRKIAEYFGVSVDYLETGEEKEKADYSTANAELADLILTDKKLSEALQVYAKLNQVQKDAIINMINSYKTNE